MGAKWVGLGPAGGWRQPGSILTRKRSFSSRSSMALRKTFPLNLSMEKMPRGSSSTPGPLML